MREERVGEGGQGVRYLRMTFGSVALTNRWWVAQSRALMPMLFKGV